MSIVKKLKLIDVFIILFVLLSTYLLSRFFSRSNQMLTLRVKVTQTDPYYGHTDPQTWLASRIKTGDHEYDSVGRIKSTILQIDRIESTENSPRESEMDNPVPRQNVYVTLNTNAVYDTRTQSYYLNGQNITFGSPVSFVFSRAQFDGIVTEIGEINELYQHRPVIVETVLRNPSREFSETNGVPDYQANAIKEGDVVLDSNGNIIVKVLSVIKRPAKRTTISNNHALVVNDPLLFDVAYRLEIKTRLINNEPYFLDTIPLKIGYSLPLNFTHTRIQPTITSVITGN